MYRAFLWRRVCKYGLATLLAVPSLALASVPMVERSVVVMGAPLTFKVQGVSRVEASAAIEAAVTRVHALDDLMTTWRPEGELALVNAKLADRAAAERGVPLSPELAAYLVDALHWARKTRGVFDPSVGSLVDAWGLQSGGRVPTPDELETARAASGFEHASVEPGPGGDLAPRLRSEVAGIAFDLGAIGKGMALDAAAEVLRAHGIESALIDFGGQVLALGPPLDAPAWIVGITHPEKRQQMVFEIPLARGSVATSSNVERGLVVDGVSFGHILDPRTGRPAVTRASVSVLAPTATAADALASALIVGGIEETAGIVAREGGSWVLLEPSEDGEAPLCRASTDLSDHCADMQRRVFPHSGRSPHPGDPQETDQ
jgi:thiamine biosynthesis lipoprotein